MASFWLLPPKHSYMFRNYLKTAFRNLIRHKLFSVLNIIGLSTGMACSILIFLWVQNEKSYDRFHPNAKNIYRITARVMDMHAAITPIPMAYAAKAEIPGITIASSISPLQRILTINHQKFDDKEIYYADAAFLKLFNFPILKGDPNTVLTRPDEIVITEKAAKKYFGSADMAIGKIIKVEDGQGTPLTVSAVLKDIPGNSHLQFDLLLPRQQYEMTRNANEAWNNFDVYNYIQTDQKDIAKLEKQLNALYAKNDKTQTPAKFELQPLTSIHLNAHLFMDVEGHGNSQYVTIFSLVAVFILLIACINFMNLSTAISGQRAKEVGLRKTIGAVRIQLVFQFLSESLLLAIVALIIGLMMAYLLLPVFNTIASKSISINLLNINVILLLLGTAVGVGLLSGSYPALFLSSFNPVKVLKGVKNLHGGTNYFRNGLVVIQFSVSVILIISTVVVYQQLQYIRHRDIGFNKDNLLYTQIPDAGDRGKNYDVLRAKVSQQSNVGNFSFVSHLPTDLRTGEKLSWPGMNENDLLIVPQIWVDESFISVFGMKLLAGRTFFKDDKADAANYIVNEATVKKIGSTIEKAVGTELSFGDRKGVIIGVVKDFNFRPVQKVIEPLVLRKFDGYANGTAGFIVQRSKTADIRHDMAQTRKILDPVFPDFPFLQGFINEDIARLYSAELRMGRLFNIFSVLSVIVSCLGLFGLATFSTQKRIKEIGVRKVLGASAAGIVAMLSRDFIRLVILALVIAFPVSWMIMNKWLDNFAYRTAISWWMFVLAGGTAILIAFLTVSYQSVKAALSNPVKSLRSE